MKNNPEKTESFQSSPTGGVRGGCTVKCPGTVANLVCGFDILGMALNEPYDIMRLELLDEPKVVITNKDDFNLRLIPRRM